MESVPLVLSWRAGRRLHAGAALLAVGLGGPLGVLALLCLRDLIAVLPQDDAPALPLLRLALWSPSGDMVLMPGFSMRAVELERAAFLGIAACALALAGIGWGVARLCFQAQNRAADAVRERRSSMLRPGRGTRPEACRASSARSWPGPTGCSPWAW